MVSRLQVGSHQDVKVRREGGALSRATTTPCVAPECGVRGERQQQQLLLGGGWGGSHSHRGGPKSIRGNRWEQALKRILHWCVWQGEREGGQEPTLCYHHRHVCLHGQLSVCLPARHRLADTDLGGRGERLGGQGGGGGGAEGRFDAVEGLATGLFPGCVWLCGHQQVNDGGCGARG